MRAARLIVVLLTGCAPELSVVELAVSPGDLVIAVDAEGERAAVAIVGEDGTASTSAPAEGDLVFAVLPRGSAIDRGGTVLTWDGVTVDLRGDVEGCGCSAPALELPQSVAPGDRCALPRAVVLHAPNDRLDAESEAELRARLRVTWPGQCACAQPDVTPALRVEVCPLGEGAQRMLPDRLAVTAADTHIAINRAVVVHVLASGERREHVLEPPMSVAIAIEVLPTGDALVLAHEYVPLGRYPDLRLLPRDGTSAPVVLEGLDRELSWDKMLWDRGRERLWAVGRVGNDVRRRPAIARCTIDEQQRGVACLREPLPADSRCPQFSESEAVVGMVDLGGGDALAMTYHAKPIIIDGARDRVVCVPGAERPAISVGESTLTDVRIQQLSAVGRKAVACIFQVTAEGVQSAVFTAEIGRISEDAQVRWSQVARVEADLVTCLEPFQDPSRPGRVFQPLTRPGGDTTLVEVSETSSTVVLHSGAGALFEGLETPVLRFASSPGHLAGFNIRGELLDLDDGTVTMRLGTQALGGARDRTVRALAPAGDGAFVVDLGGAAPLRVESRARNGCADTRLVVPDGAYALGEVETDALGTLGARTLRARHDRMGASLEVRGAAGDVRTHTLEAAVRSMAELSPDRWAIFVDVEGGLWATDGERVSRLVSASRFTQVDASGGVGWAIGDEGVARVLVRADAPPRVEDNLLSRAEVDARALAGLAAQVPTAIRARACGRAQLALREEPIVWEGATSVWWIEPSGDGLVVRPDDGFDVSGPARPLGFEWVGGISGSERTPLYLFNGGAWSHGVQASGPSRASLPFVSFSAFAYADGDVLVGGPNARLTLVRVR